MDAARAVYDWLSKHPDIDVGRSVIWSVSMGSFFGLQAAAALGDKVRGAAVTFICHEPGLFSLINRSAPSFKMRFMYMSGHTDEDEFDRFIERFSLAPIAGDIKCPVLIQAGEDDELSPLEFSDELAGMIRSPKKLVIYEGERHAIGGTIFHPRSAKTGLRCWPTGASNGLKASRRRMSASSSTRSDRRRWNLIEKVHLLRARRATPGSQRRPG